MSPIYLGRAIRNPQSVVMQNPDNGLYMASSAPSSEPSVASSAYSPANSIIHARPTMRHPLPNRQVDIHNIENTYVAFILACNPAVPLGVDTTALREAFRTPPRSDGRNFSIYMLYLLIRDLEERVIKTWAELALKLGVEPPDQEKGQSSQKIQQYAVRLKRWMHSMHVDAFFDYVMGRQHPYWTEIPPENYPISELLRDGVAAKDDMALRALVPEIKPRRGRKRDDESDSDYAGNREPQHQRLDNYSDDMGRWAGGQNAGGGGGGGGGMFGYPSNQQQLSPDGTMRASPPWASSADGMSTPMSHGGFWSDEPKSAGAASSTSSGRRPGRRHGAKVVSSAWRSNGSGGSGKTRGRPPLNRSSNQHALPPVRDGSFPPVSAIEQPTTTTPTSAYLPHMDMDSAASYSPLSPSAGSTFSGFHAVPAMSNVDNMSNMSNAGGASGSAYAAATGDSGMGMHIPGISPPFNSSITDITLNSYGASQLGMPPSMGFVPSELLHSPPAHPHAHAHSYPHSHPHSHPHHHPHQPMRMHPMTATTSTPPSVTSDAAPSYTSEPMIEPMIDSMHKPGEGKNAMKEPNNPLSMCQSRFGSGSPNDRTNVDELEAFFLTEMFAATWYDENDNKITPCSVEEATALVEIVINDLTKAAATKEAFLINLAALAGGKILMANTNVRVKRLESTAEHTKYHFSWELRYGDVRSGFSIQESVPHSYWKKLTNEVKAAVARAVGFTEESCTIPKPEAGSGSSSSFDKAQFTGTGLGTPAASLSSATVAQPQVGVDGQNKNTQNTQNMQNTAAFAPALSFGLPPTGGHSRQSSGHSSDGGIGGASTSTATNLGDENAALAALWERKYRHLLHLLYKRDQQMDRTRASVLRGLQATYRNDDSFDI